MTPSDEQYPPDHWTNDQLVEAYGIAAANYKQIMTVTPEQDQQTFRNANRLLADAQDVRQKLHERGVDTPGILLP